MLSDALRAQLATLNFTPRTRRQTGQRGERRSAQRGTSIEFADFRPYVAGDDLRKLDWNITARLDKPTIKLYEDEQDLTVYLLIDVSMSMGGTEDNRQKWEHLQRLASALGWIALRGGDALCAVPLATPTVIPFRARGRDRAADWLAWLQTLQPSGQTDLNATLKTFAVREGRAGLCVLLTDAFSPSGQRDGINAVLAKGHELTFLHLLARDEIQPTLVGDLRLIDVETNDAQEVTIDATRRIQYAESLKQWQEELHRDCLRRGIPYLCVPSDTPIQQTLLKDLRTMEVVG